MTDLQTAYYIIGIIFMSLMLIMGIALLVAVLVIRKKITALHDHIADKLSLVNNLAEKGGAVLGAIKKSRK